MEQGIKSGLSAGVYACVCVCVCVYRVCVKLFLLRRFVAPMAALRRYPENCKGSLRYQVLSYLDRELFCIMINARTVIFVHNLSLISDVTESKN